MIHTSMEVKLVSVVNGKPDTLKAVNEVHEGDVFVIWIKNHSDVPLYLNIIDIQPDGIINPVLPNKKERLFPSEMQIKENSSHLFEKYLITVFPPYGKEQFKIFAAYNEINMGNIVTSNGDAARRRGGNLSPLEDLIYEGFKTRGTGVKNLNKTEGSIYDLFFEIKPKK